MTENKKLSLTAQQPDIACSKIYSFIGLARKAGAVSPGEALAEQAVKRERAYLVLLAQDASENTKKKIRTALYKTDIPLLEFGNKADLGRMLGKTFFSVIAVTDKGFAERIMELIKQNCNNSVHGGGIFE